MPSRARPPQSPQACRGARPALRLGRDLDTLIDRGAVSDTFHGLIAHAAILDECDLGELIDYQFWIRGAGVAKIAHLIQMVVLEADGLFGVLCNPGWEEDYAVHPAAPPD
jgi:hypothetical protein